MPDDARLLNNWSEPISTRKAFCDLARLTIPIVSGAFLNVGADRVSLSFVGHWDYKDITHYDGASIGKMYSNITGLSLGVAATIGLATFASQAYGCGLSRELNPIYFRRCLLLLLGCYAFAFTSAVIAHPLLVMLGQPPAVAKTSALYAQVQLIGVPFFWLTSSVTMLLNATKRTKPGLLMSIVSSIAQLLFCGLLTDPKIGGMGYLGVALGRSLAGIVGLLFLLFYVRWAKLEDFVWKKVPDAEHVCKPGAFRHYLAVSLPSALIVWSEWWAFEVLAVFAGLTPNADQNLAAHGTMFNLVAITYMCWTSTCSALCTLVGNKLGEEKNQDIPPLLRAAFFWSFSTSMTVSIGYELLKGQLAHAYTEDEAVQKILRNSSIGLVLSVPLYAQLMTFFGALRGANRQSPGIWGNVVGYWIVGLPLGGVMGCIWHWPTPLVGIWLGNVIALLIAATWVLIAVFVRTDWASIRKVQGIGPATLPEVRERASSAELRRGNGNGSFVGSLAAMEQHLDETSSSQPCGLEQKSD